MAARTQAKPSTKCVWSVWHDESSYGGDNTDCYDATLLRTFATKRGAQQYLAMIGTAEVDDRTSRHHEGFRLQRQPLAEDATVRFVPSSHPVGEKVEGEVVGQEPNDRGELAVLTQGQGFTVRDPEAVSFRFGRKMAWVSNYRVGDRIKLVVTRQEARLRDANTIEFHPEYGVAVDRFGAPSDRPWIKTYDTGEVYTVATFRDSQWEDRTGEGPSGQGELAERRTAKDTVVLVLHGGWYKLEKAYYRGEGQWSSKRYSEDGEIPVADFFFVTPDEDPAHKLAEAGYVVLTDRLVYKVD